MPIHIPLKWKQVLYQLTMLLGRKKMLSSPSVTKSITSVYPISLIDINGNTIDLSIYRGKYLLIVNVASECGFTPQYNDLQKLYEKYIDKLVVLAFPSNDFGGQEPGSNEEIKHFCSKNYHITFPLLKKIEIIGTNQHALYNWLSDELQNGWNNKLPKWNFCKYLVDSQGNLLNYFSQHVSPFDEEIISKLK
jgi:glutathione peroxidase